MADGKPHPEDLVPEQQPSHKDSFHLQSFGPTCHDTTARLTPTCLGPTAGFAWLPAERHSILSKAKGTAKAENGTWFLCGD